MRTKAPLILAVLAIVLALAGLAEAGRYHQAASLACADCHMMHGQQQHSSTGSTTGFPVTINSGAGVANLLRNAGGTNALCLACHDGQTTAPDVLGTDQNSGANASLGGRSAGALNNNGNAVAPYQDWKGHSLGSTSVAPGGTFAATAGNGGFRCTNCHDQHGNTNFRNLRSKDDTGLPLGTTTITDVLSTTATNNTANVRINLASYTASAANTAATRAPYYSNANIFYHEPTGNANNFTTFCVNCHTSFTSSGTTKHPSNAAFDVGGTNNTNYNIANWASLAKVKVTATDYSLVNGPTTASPFCQTCHQGHGNDNAFGLIFMDRSQPSSAINEQGTTGGTETHLCGQCHTQAN